MKIAGKGEYEALRSLYEQSVLKEAHTILADPLHILNTEYELLNPRVWTLWKMVLTANVQV